MIKKFLYSILLLVCLLPFFYVMYLDYGSWFSYVTFTTENKVVLFLLILACFGFYKSGSKILSGKTSSNKIARYILVFFTVIQSVITLLYILKLWFRYSESNALSIENKMLIAASFLSVVGLIIVYYFQKKGVLNYKFVHFVLLLFSIAFLCGSSFLLYTSYETYSESLIEIEVVKSDTKRVVSKMIFRKDEIDVYKDLIENRNTLLGYEDFLIDMVQTYEPNKYSYANVLKEEFINELSNKQGTQFYWDEILTAMYSYDSIPQEANGTGYAIMFVISDNGEYPNEDITEIKDFKLIREKSLFEHIKREVLDINRESENIESLWQHNKGYLYAFFSKSKYNDLCKQVVDDLIEVKNKIVEQPNYQEFYDTHSVLDSDFYSFPDPDFVDSYQYYWPFNFWDRRFEENNVDAVYKILTEIQKHYQD